MATVNVTLEVEFETNSEAAARAALIRIPGDLVHSIQHGAVGMTGVTAGSVKVKKTFEKIS
jgi:hypothetical protein